MSELRISALERAALNAAVRKGLRDHGSAMWRGVGALTAHEQHGIDGAFYTLELTPCPLLVDKLGLDPQGECLGSEAWLDTYLAVVRQSRAQAQLWLTAWADQVASLLQDPGWCDLPFGSVEAVTGSSANPDTGEHPRLIDFRPAPSFLRSVQPTEDAADRAMRFYRL